MAIVVWLAVVLFIVVVARQTRHSDHRLVVCDLFLDP